MCLIYFKIASSILLVMFSSPNKPSTETVFRLGCQLA
jgi:hypothetical protein